MLVTARWELARPRAAQPLPQPHLREGAFALGPLLESSKGVKGCPKGMGVSLPTLLSLLPSLISAPSSPRGSCDSWVLEASLGAGVGGVGGGT